MIILNGNTMIAAKFMRLEISITQMQLQLKTCEMR